MHVGDEFPSHIIPECTFSSADNEYKEPASILFVLMFLAQHHSFLGNTEKALRLIERALEHTPTLIELYIIKGKILKVSSHKKKKKLVLVQPCFQNYRHMLQHTYDCLLEAN